MRSPCCRRSRAGPAEVFDPVQNFVRTYAVRQPVGGPRLRLGVIWFAALLAALLAGSFALTVLFGAIAAIGALQVAGQWRHRRVAVNQTVAGAGAGLMVLGAWSSVRAAAFGLLAMAMAAVLFGAGTQLSRAALEPAHLRSNLSVASATLRSGMLLGLGAAATVQVHRVDPMMFVYLMSVACVYDCGDYLIGSGSRNRLVGPIAGLVGVAVVVVAMTAINPPPLTDDGSVRALGLAMALACPLGQLVGSWMLPSAAAKAPALRRLDSWILTAPVCLVGLWILT